MKFNESKILITGGSGMVGNAMKTVLPAAHYPTSKELDLRYFELVNNFLDNGNCDNGPKYDAVIHLAAKVGGVEANTSYMADFYSINSRINQNLLDSCMLNDIPKVVSLLSTCVYPDAPYVNYPLTENQLHLGPPHSSNYGYAFSKRMLDVQSRALRQQYGCNFITAIPNNLMGEHDNFDLENSHVIPALIRKVWESKINKRPEIIVWGDGSPLREFTYSADVAKALVWLLENYDGAEPVNIGCTTEISIKEVVEKICDILGYDGKIRWNTTKPNGQLRKPSSNEKFLKLGWKESDYTPFDEALEKTCYWFAKNYPKVRGI